MPHRICLAGPERPSGGVFDYMQRLKRALDIKNTCEIVQLVPGTLKLLPLREYSHFILQYSGYGFQKRGAPLWLTREIERNRHRIATLGVYFHELYAFAPPWRSSFWLSPIQRCVALDLARLCDFWLTNTVRHTEWLTRRGPERPHATLPVFSNFYAMESEQLANKLPVIVVLGSEHVRRRTYKAVGRSLFEWAGRHGYRVVDIGASDDDDGWPSQLAQRPHERLGHVDIASAHAILTVATFGILAYPLTFLPKSGVFAAFCAHKICTIILSRRDTESDGLCADINYLTELPNDDLTVVSQRVGEASFSWYAPHSLSVHASIIMTL